MALNNRKRPLVEKLVDRINKLNPKEREQLAKACDTSFGNLRQIAYGFGGCSIAQAIKINKVCPDISLSDLIPELKSGACNDPINPCDDDNNIA